MSSSPLNVGITIRATGGAQTASDLTQVQTAVTGAGTAAQASNRQFAEMAASMRSAETAAQAINARIASATAIYDNQVARLTMTTSAYRAYQLQLDGLHPSQIRHIQDLEAARAAATSTSATMSGLGSVMNAFGLTLGAVGLAALAKDILDTNRSMESLRAQLKALTGSTAEAQQTFEFITRFATDTPFEIDSLTKAFITLKNFGITPTTQVMDAITNQAAKLGGSTVTLNGITLALGQAWAKGKLQGQEIMQLINQNVPVYDLLAKVTGKNATQLADMSEKGLLTR
ncbi:MAG: tape measure protein, partial [Methylococcales bacterium]